MSAGIGWRREVEDNREALERIADHGRTELANHVRAVLDEYDAQDGGEA